jgi:opacity protein-like surface antigen
MTRKILSSSIVAGAAMTAGAQVAASVPPPQFEGEQRGVASVQWSRLEFTGQRASRSGLGLGVDYAVSPNIVLGASLQSDRRIGDDPYNIDWWNLRATTYPVRAERHGAGFSLGYLRANIRSEEVRADANWIEPALVGHVALDGQEGQAPRIWLSGNVGFAFGIDSNDTLPSNAFTYGVGISYRATETISVDLGARVMDYTDTGAGRFTRVTLGIGYRF